MRAATRNITRPVLRYHGGKWRLAPWIISHFPPHRLYVEPYGGGASVLMRKPRSYSEVYNDLASEIVNVFKVLQDDEKAARLEKLLRLTPYAREEFDGSYEMTDDLVELARRTIIRSLQGYGSASTTREHATGFRAHASRSGTTPAHDWVKYPRNLVAFTERLRGVVIESRDALEVIRQQDTPETLFYVDPPYPHSTRNSNHQCYVYEMTDADHEQLAELLHSVVGKVVLPGYDCDLYGRLYGDWERTDCETMASSQKSSVARIETLWMNGAAASTRSQQQIRFQSA